MPNAPDPTEARSKDADTKQIYAASPSANYGGYPKWYLEIVSTMTEASAPHKLGTVAEFREATEQFVELFKGVGPKTATEGMLAAHMILAHNQAMDCLSRANIPKQTFEGRSENLKHAEKLMMALAQLVEALDKHRGKGQQQITVQRVNVASGGQAVVGNVNTGKRTMASKTDKNAQVSKGIEHQHQDNANFDRPSQAKEIDGVLLEEDDIC